jgi:2Fe-2S ferredoxin
MTTLKILPHVELCPNGAEISAPVGTTICEALLDNGIKIEHACDQSCACTTCHVIVREGFGSLNAAEEDEEDLLDRAWGLQPQSRLSCQAIVGRQELTIEIPRYTINHAKENH